MASGTSIPRTQESNAIRLLRADETRGSRALLRLLDDGIAAVHMVTLHQLFQSEATAS